MGVSAWQTMRDPRFIGALALFVLLAAAYVPSVGLRATRGASITADEPFYLLTTQSIVQDFDLDLRQQYARESYRSFFDHPDGLWTQSVPLPDGRLMSPHEPGFSVYLLPGFAIGGLRGAQVQMLLTASAAFALTYVLVASETRATLASWVATVVVGLTAAAFVYSTEIYPEVPAALCIVLALLVLRRPRLRCTHAIVLAVILTALAWLGMKYVPLVALLGVWAFRRGGRDARLALLGLGAVSAAVYAGGHLALFGSLTAYSANTVYEGASTVDVMRSHVSGAGGIGGRAYRIVGLFVDERFGVGRWAPALLPTLPLLPLLVRRGRVGSVVAALVVMQVLIATFVAITMMGWWFPGRTLVAVLPLASYGLAEALRRAPRTVQAALVAMSAYSVLVTAALALAARSGEVTLALDPFAMSSAVFRAPAALFPDYRQWTVDTHVLHWAWLAAGIALLLIAARSALGRQVHLRRLGTYAEASAVSTSMPRARVQE